MVIRNGIDMGGGECFAKKQTMRLREKEKNDPHGSDSATTGGGAAFADPAGLGPEYLRDHRQQ